MITLDEVLDAIMQLQPEKQDMLIDIVKKRRIESRRKEIATYGKKAIDDVRTGKLKPKPLNEIIEELR